jgi:hypothetical protein
MTLVPLMYCPRENADNELLKTATEVLGPMPAVYLRNWDPKEKAKFVDEKGNLISGQKQRRKRLGEQMFRDNPPGMSWEETDVFYDFMKNCLQWSPYHRWSAEALLEHEWVQKYLKVENKPGAVEQEQRSVSTIESDDEDWVTYYSINSR